jgi:hypothetical protein
MSGVLDKTTESMFGYISVLVSGLVIGCIDFLELNSGLLKPGAFSAYRCVPSNIIRKCF